MKKLDRVGLKNFVFDGEKLPPPVFVGRQDVLDDIILAANRAWVFRAHGYPGATRIVHGAPGAGKSSLIDEVKNRLKSRTECNNSPTLVNLHFSRLFNPTGVLQELATTINRDKAANLFAQQQITQSGSGRVGFSSTGVSTSFETTTIRPPPPPELHVFDAWLNSLPKSKQMQRPIIVAIDEAQNLCFDQSGTAASLICGLHDPVPQRPITLVVAGLGNTEHVMLNLGISRGLKIHHLSCFDEVEMERVMVEFCHHYGIDVGNSHTELMMLAKPTDGWPSHLHCAQNVLASAVLSEEVDGKLDQITDWHSILAESMKLRERYYYQRFSKFMKISRRLLGKLMTNVVDGSSDTSVRKVIREHLRDVEGWTLPDGMSVQQFFEHLLHQGALEECGDGTVHCPIPSFRTFLIEASQR